MTKGEAIRIVEGWVKRNDALSDPIDAPPYTAIKRLLQEVKASGR